MESEKNQILHIENIDKHEVSLQSPNMERGDDSLFRFSSGKWYGGCGTDY